MKLVISFFLVCLALSLNAQEAKPAKIRYTSDFFGNRFEIGDKDAKKNAVLLHLEKTSPKGYFDFRKGVNQEKTSLVFSVISGACLGWYFIESNKLNKNVALLGFSTTAIVAISLEYGSKNKYRKGVDAYNQQFGF